MKEVIIMTNAERLMNKVFDLMIFRGTEYFKVRKKEHTNEYKRYIYQQDKMKDFFHEKELEALHDYVSIEMLIEDANCEDDFCEYVQKKVEDKSMQKALMGLFKDEYRNCWMSPDVIGLMSCYGPVVESEKDIPSAFSRSGSYISTSRIERANDDETAEDIGYKWFKAYCFDDDGNEVYYGDYAVTFEN